MEKDYIDELFNTFGYFSGISLDCIDNQNNEIRELEEQNKHQQKIIDRLSRKIQSKNKELKKYQRLYGKSIKAHLQKDKKIEELKEQLECSQTNEETYRLEMLDITKILGLDENTLFEDVKKYASKLQHIIDELEKWLEDEIKQYDNVGLKFKKQGNFECASRSYDYLKQYQTMLSKLQELKGSDNNV